MKPPKRLFPMRILIVKLSALGDVIQTLPVLKALKSARPHVEIHWVVEPPAQQILEGHPLLDRLLVFPRRQIIKEKNWGLLRDFGRSLRAFSYDVVLDLQGLLKSALVVAAARARLRVGFANHREGSPFFYNLKLPPYDPDLHAVRRYLLALEVLGVRASAPVFTFPPLPDPKELFSRYGLQGPVAVFIPRARWESKLWREDGWQELCRKFEAKGLTPVLVGAKADLPYLLRLKANTQAQILAGLRLTELASLLKGARVIVTVDTGPMHLAAALGKPVVALFGPTAPWRTGPFGRGHQILGRKSPCSPCFRKVCAEKSCLNRLEAEEVWEACQKLINGPV